MSAHGRRNTGATLRALSMDARNARHRQGFL
jgi:hypothetical protein